tara:strand:- start:938 stop:2254 length:1317 start_codon:yes stop_codon:yes gene_type:complete
MTAGNSNEYGDDSFKNRFIDPETGEAYFLIINKQTGKIKIYNEEFGADKYVGEYDPKTGKIEYNKNLWGGANKKDKAFINNAIKTGKVKEHAKTVIARELREGEKDGQGKTDSKNNPESADKKASELMGEVQLDIKEESDAEGTGEAVNSGDKDTREGAFVYPDTLREGKQDTIRFTQVKYRASGFNQEGVNAAGNRNSVEGARIALGTVILPIPGEISAGQKTDWNQGELSIIDAAKIKAVTTAVDKASFGSGVESVLNSLQAGAQTPGIKNALAAALAQTTTGGRGNVLQRSTGQVLNPNMETLFKGPQIRGFNFTFKLSPRNPKEAERILQIIRFFKQGMAPIRSESLLFLKSPNIFELKYTHNGGDHKGLNKFKECALKSCEITYNPDAGEYSTFPDGVMNSYQMALGFQELEPIYNDDYGSNEAGVIPASLGF